MRQELLQELQPERSVVGLKRSRSRGEAALSSDSEADQRARGTVRG